MMTLSQTTGYAIHALSFLDVCDGEVRLIRDVATATGIPQPYLAKIINTLAHSGIIASKRGHGGGICLKRPAAQISLLDVVVAIEGERWIGPCLLGLDDCAARGICPTKIIWGSIKSLIEESLKNTTLADVIAHRKKTTAQTTAAARRAPTALDSSAETGGCHCAPPPAPAPPPAADARPPTPPPGT